MCGICGKINCHSEPIDKDQIAKMMHSFSYRGPDDEGVFICSYGVNSNTTLNVGFGHKRLSVIDLTYSAHQPMSNEDGTLWITYNGEIYNYRELRAGLECNGHRFKSDSDTEVVLHLYEEKGLQAVEQFNGMYAFALWDENRHRLWLCRDRLGIKPLVYYWDGKHFIFASEIKALLADSAIPRELNEEALYLYLAFSYVPAPHTIFKDIKKLKPGHSLILEKGELFIEEHWEVPKSVDPYLSSLSFAKQTQYYKQELFKCIEEATVSRMMADVPLGAFLSGGIDSSIIVALMARHSEKPVKTFSIGFKNDALFDETPYARRVAQLCNTDHHEIKIDYKDMLESLPRVFAAFDEPFADSSAIPTYIVSRETRKHVTVALSGDGGDELFAGYRSYSGEYWYAKYLMIPGILREGIIEKLINALPDSRDTPILEVIRRLKKFIKSTKGSFSERQLALKEVFPSEIRQKILLPKPNRSHSKPEDQALKWVQNLLDFYEDDPINKMLYSDLKDSLPGDMLTKVDWMSMTNSLEVRIPFLDHRVVELAFQMQGTIKLHKGKTKYILKETFKDILPSLLYNRPKAGFEIPISRWLKSDLNFLLEHYLSEKRIRDQGIFDAKIIKQLVAQLLTNRTDTSWMLWNMIVFQIWYEKYFN